MIFIVAAFLANLGLVSFRFQHFVPPVKKSDPLYVSILTGCLAADLVASYGFYELIQTQGAHIRSYSLIITTLALLAAVALIGKFSFSREGARPARRFGSWLSSMLVVVSLYALFGSIAYFSKVIQDTKIMQLAYLFIPAVMLIVLWINTGYDAWDYADSPDIERRRLLAEHRAETRS
ncbi:MAG: hypothetical protein FJX54_17090 [Alphaproteobacteria bacterium]|nr:hypothetical protein [Alphaproteobacteria bacterium]